MSLFDEFISALGAGLREMASRQWREYRSEVVRDGRAFAESFRMDLERWMRQLHEGALTPDDFAWLVRGKRDLAEMEALRAAGLAEVELDRLRAALVDSVVGAALKVV